MCIRDSVIRDLVLNPGCYDSLLHFFRASSWSLEDIRKRWFSAVRLYAPLYKEGNYHILVGDGVKQSKEGRRMPGVKKLFQESENSAKPEYIHGHMFGGLGILAGSVRNWACIPLSIRLHDGLQAAREWKGASVSEASHVVQMVEDAYHATLTFGDPCSCWTDISSLFQHLKSWEPLTAVGMYAWRSLPKQKNPVPHLKNLAPADPEGDGPPKKGLLFT